MTKNFNIKDVKPGDVLTARDTWKTARGIAPIAHKWIVVSNSKRDDLMGNFVEVYILYGRPGRLDIQPSGIQEKRYSFYYGFFRSWQQKMTWVLEHDAGL